MSFKHKHFGLLLNVKTEVGHDYRSPFCLHRMLENSKQKY